MLFVRARTHTHTPMQTEGQDAQLHMNSHLRLSGPHTDREFRSHSAPSPWKCSEDDQDRPYGEPGPGIITPLGQETTP